MREIGYNSQRDNFDFAGKFPGWAQCFTTSSWMLMSYYTDQIVAGDDSGLSRYLDDIEASIGKPGAGERIKQKYNWITGKTSYWWLTQKYGIEKWLWKYGVSGDCKFFDGNYLISDLPSLLERAPIIIATNKMGGLPGGHIVLLVDYDPINFNFFVNDPYGNATYRYQDADGFMVKYNMTWMAPFISISQNKCRIMYFEVL